MLRDSVYFEFVKAYKIIFRCIGKVKYISVNAKTIEHCHYTLLLFCKIIFHTLFIKYTVMLEWNQGNKDLCPISLFFFISFLNGIYLSYMIYCKDIDFCWAHNNSIYNLTFLTDKNKIRQNHTKEVPRNHECNLGYHLVNSLTIHWMADRWFLCRILCSLSSLWSLFNTFERIEWISIQGR